MSFARSVFAGLLATTAPAYAQEAAPPTAVEAPIQEEPAADDVEEEIVVTGQRQRGAVIGDIPPEVQLDARDVRALGASSIAEVLDAIAPQTQSGRGRGGGRPIILLNGQRISGFREIRNLPPEAIQRVDILPEEVALKYGYRADQRVVNFVLRRRFRAVTAEAEYGVATEGGRDRYEADLNLLRIDRAGRWELDAEYSHEAPLFESERDLDTELGEFRTLLPETDTLELSGTLNRTIFGDVGATVNATFEATDSESQFGLAPFDAPGPLTRETDSKNGHFGVVLNGQLTGWQWSFTGNYDRGNSVTLTDRADVLDLRDRAETDTEVVNGQLVANGSLFELPAGEVSSTFRAGFERQGLESEANRLDVITTSDLSRTIGNAQANIDIPIASRRRDVLSGLGDLSANFNAEIEQLSDFGTLRTLGGGLNWSPIEEVRLIASVTDEEGAPTIQQLGDPLIQTPNVRVFDFTLGETVDVTRLSGGNPDLIADSRRVWKVGLNIRPLDEKDLSITADYTNSRIRDSIAGFPAITPEIEAAFPERFQRGADGRLTSIDVRPVNFERVDRQELRWGINFSKPIASARPPREGLPTRVQERIRRREAERAAGTQGGAQEPTAGTAGTAPPAGEQAAPPAREGGQRRQRVGGGGQGGGGGGRFGGFGGGRFGGGGRGGRLQFALYHTWRFEDSILIREGVPELDLLDGSAVGNRGGRPRHEIEGQAGIFKNGYGARLTGTWLSGTEVRGVSTGPGAGTGTTDLAFSDFATVNLRLFANLGEQQIVKQYPWLRGTRVSLEVNNLFNARPEVSDAAGLTPLGYFPDELDPLGRTVTLSIRKLFF